MHRSKQAKEPEIKLNTKYLHMQLLRIDLLIRKAVRQWELSGQDFSEKFRGLFLSEKNIQDILNRPIGGNWGTGIDLPAQEIEQFNRLHYQVEEELTTIREKAKQNGMDLKLEQFVRLFDLTEFEFDAFLICLAPSIDTRFERIYGYLQDDVTNRFASVGLIFDLLITPGLEKIRYFASFDKQSNLLKNELIKPLTESSEEDKPLIKQNYFVPNEILIWITGQFVPSDKLSNAVRLSYPESLDQPANDIIDLPDDLSTLLDQQPFLVLYGQDELQKYYIADHIAGLADQPLLFFDLKMLGVSPIKDAKILDLLFRDVKLCNAIPVIKGWDNFFENSEDIHTIFQKMSEFKNTIIVFHMDSWPIIRNESQTIKPVIWINCNQPSSSKRLEVWKRYLGNTSVIIDSDLEILAGQFNLTATQIQNAVYSANDLAFKKGIPVSIDDLYEAARSYSSHHLNSLASKIQPRYRWEDIVLPEDGLAALRELSNRIRWRSVVLDDWGVGERLMPYSGVSALFAGPPGTGKTLAAQVISAELKMDLYKIDLSTVVSKYIGETEKNLERIFSQAKNSNAILFFDEADSIFGKRSEVKDAHDRYANIEVGYLLQRMETYDGVVILATNLRSNLDDAFTRRIQFIIEFPFPDENERKRIWEVLFPPGVPKSDDIDVDELGSRFRLTGGSIRNVIISASFLAVSENSPVTNNHLTHAIRREMQKMGRLVNDKDLVMPHKEGNNGKNSK
jgi:SpoVK/Ycf46/Vps4 family AAA+-type ATPase